eukprot:m.87295 g.87295  ORF g.87295 m.87295 type:complete len:103 (-) comp11546_c0_seq4:1474-1782(-)
MLASMLLMGTLAIVACAAPSATQQKHVLFVVADDLGRNDLSHFNGGLSETPAIDDLLSNGIFLESYYTFKVCSVRRRGLQQEDSASPQSHVYIFCSPRELAS